MSASSNGSTSGPSSSSDREHVPDWLRSKTSDEQKLLYDTLNEEIAGCKTRQVYENARNSDNPAVKNSVLDMLFKSVIALFYRNKSYKEHCEAQRKTRSHVPVTEAPEYKEAVSRQQAAEAEAADLQKALDQSTGEVNVRIAEIFKQFEEHIEKTNVATKVIDKLRNDVETLKKTKAILEKKLEDSELFSKSVVEDQINLMKEIEACGSKENFKKLLAEFVAYRDRDAIFVDQTAQTDLSCLPGSSSRPQNVMHVPPPNQHAPTPPPPLLQYQDGNLTMQEMIMQKIIEQQHQQIVRQQQPQHVNQQHAIMQQQQQQQRAMQQPQTSMHHTPPAMMQPPHGMHPLQQLPPSAMQQPPHHGMQAPRMLPPPPQMPSSSSGMFPSPTSMQQQQHQAMPQQPQQGMQMPQQNMQQPQQFGYNPNQPFPANFMPPCGGQMPGYPPPNLANGQFFPGAPVDSPSHSMNSASLQQRENVSTIRGHPQQLQQQQQQDSPASHQCGNHRLCESASMPQTAQRSIRPSQAPGIMSHQELSSFSHPSVAGELRMQHVVHDVDSHVAPVPAPAPASAPAKKRKRRPRASNTNPNSSHLQSVIDEVATTQQSKRSRCSTSIVPSMASSPASSYVSPTDALLSLCDRAVSEGLRTPPVLDDHPTLVAALSNESVPDKVPVAPEVQLQTPALKAQPQVADVSSAPEKNAHLRMHLASNSSVSTPNKILDTVVPVSQSPALLPPSTFSVVTVPLAPEPVTTQANFAIATTEVSSSTPATKKKKRIDPRLLQNVVFRTKLAAAALPTTSATATAVVRSTTDVINPLLVKSSTSVTSSSSVLSTASVSTSDKVVVVSSRTNSSDSVIPADPSMPPVSSTKEVMPVPNAVGPAGDASSVRASISAVKGILKKIPTPTAPTAATKENQTPAAKSTPTRHQVETAQHVVKETAATAISRVITPGAGGGEPSTDAAQASPVPIDVTPVPTPSPPTATVNVDTKEDTQTLRFVNLLQTKMKEKLTPLVASHKVPRAADRTTESPQRPIKSEFSTAADEENKSTFASKASLIKFTERFDSSSKLWHRIPRKRVPVKYDNVEESLFDMGTDIPLEF